MTNRPLVALGAVLAIAGLAMMIAVFTQGGPDAALQSMPQLDPPAESGGPSRAWAIVAGITLATGAACIMIGMNRWKQPLAR